MTSLGFGTLLLAIAAWIIAKARGARPPLALLLLVTTSLVTEAVAVYWAEHYGCNYFVYSLYQPVEFSLVVLLIRTEFSAPRRHWFVALSIAIFLSLFIWEAINAGVGCVFLARAFVAGCAFLCVMFVFLLFRSATSETRPLYTSPRFWLYVGFTVYYGCSVPIMGLINHIAKTDEALLLKLVLINEVLFVGRSTCIVAACVQTALSHER